jgi:hypothetical protein
MIVRQRSISRWYRRADRASVHHAPVIGRGQAVCGWLAWQVRRRFGRSGPRRAAPYAVAGLLVLLAAAPIAAPMLDPQPQDVTIQDIIDNLVTEATGWVRLRGEVVPLPESPTGQPGAYALLVDAADTLQAIVLTADVPPATAESTMVTGHVVGASLTVEEVPFEATVYGTPPVVVTDRIVELDGVAKPGRATWWPLSILPVVLAVLLVIGARSGYPIFRPTTEVDVLSTPLGPGERLPAAWGGRLGSNERDLGDPGAALLVVRPGPKGNVLTAQPLPDDDGPAPQPVAIGGGWTSGRVGYVYTATESVPALIVRAEIVDATFLFARTGERDRVAALIAVERG